MSRFLLLLVLSAATLAQRPAPQSQPRRYLSPYTYVNGRVFDADTGLAITGARVFIRCAANSGALNEVTLETDLYGAFFSTRFNERGCIVLVHAAGYVPSREDSERGPATIPPPNGESVKSLQFPLHKQAEIIGTVIDRDTEKPVPGLTVWAQWSDFERGKRRLSAAANAVTTGADGRFRLKDLPPGQYFFQISQSGQERIEGRALPSVKMSGYARTFWPGGAHESALPFYITAGARLEAGTFLVRQEPFFRVHARIDPPACAPYRKYRVVVWQQQGPDFIPRVTDVLDCGVPFTVHNLTAGAWWFESRLDGALAAFAEAALLEVEIRDKDPRVILNPLPPLQIPLKLVGDPVRLPAGVKAGFLPVGRPAHALPLPEPIEYGRRVVLAAPATEKVELRILGLPEGICVTSIRYNSGIAEDGVFRPNRIAPSHLLEVELSAHPARVDGTVRIGDKPLPGALVVIAPWPSALRADWPRTYRARASGKGTFTFESVPPGAYRAFSIDPGFRAKLEEPGVLLRLIGQAAEWEFREGERQILDLKPVEP